MLNRIKKVLTSKQGISLLETLIALTILTIIAFCFLPLFSQYMTHIKNAGKLQQETQYKTSLMERLIANKGDNPAGYEVGAGEIPLTFSCGGTEISFNDHKIKGTIIKSDDNDGIGGGNTYVTLAANSASAHMVCFPNELTDDFIQKDIYVVAKGFKFNEAAFSNSSSSDDWHFAVAYTDSDGTKKTLDEAYYDIEKIPDNGELVAKFTFYGGNQYVSFEKSPFIIGYGTGSGVINLQYTTKVRVGAPEIILVGEKAEDSKYYYYATAGVDEEGNMDIIAKEMSGDAKLKSAMNDVEWVEEGRGDDGKGGVNKYGYYIMGGDAGQVRRFWMKKDYIEGSNSENFCWGGDNLVNYNRYAWLQSNGQPQNGAFENMDEALTTQASFKSIFRADQSGPVTVNGIKVNETFDSSKVSAHDYKGLTSNYFTANLTTDEARDKAFITLGVVAKIKGSFGKMYKYYGCDTNANSKEYFKLYSWLTPGQIKPEVDPKLVEKLNVEGYKKATDYEYNGGTEKDGTQIINDTSLITITSVGAIQINTKNDENHSYHESQGSTAFKSNVYPTQSYTLYCGYIPSVTDLWGYKTGSYTGYGHIGTIGIAYGKGSWYPVGKFADIYTKSDTLSPEVFGTNESDLTYKTLLNYNSESNGLGDDSKYPNPKSGSHWYEAGKTVNNVLSAGLALPGEGTYGKLTSGKEVDVTIGYLSHPFAIALNNPEPTKITGFTGSDWYYRNADQGTKYGINATKYDHDFLSLGLRDNVTMLDVKSFHDDLTDNNISLAVGYSLSYLFSDHYWSSRLGQVFNSGIVYIRATGDGEESDGAGNLESGKGWSLRQETNVFHQFFGADQYYGDGSQAVHGWNTDYHRDYFNISANPDPFPGDPDANTVRDVEGRSDFGTNCHPMAQTECTTVNKGVTWDEKPDIMWGTENGTLLGWTYNYEDLPGSKITAVRKEFESYIWADRIGATKPLKNDGNANQFYDYNRVDSKTSTSSGFVSVLSSINDVAYGDGNWVAVGDQSGKAPSDYCASDKCYTDGGGAGSYINVKYDTGETKEVESKAGSETVTVEAPIYAWKAVKVSNDTDINFVSVTYSRGVWYALGYEDENHDGENDRDGEACIYYSRDPANSWKRAKTRSAATVNGKPVYTDTTNALLFESDGSGKGEVKEIKLTGLNSMASRG